MHHKLIFLLLIASTWIVSCDVLDDAELEPEYFVECEVDGKMYQALTKAEAYMATSIVNPDRYVVTGLDAHSEFHIDLNLFRQLGEGKIAAGTNINNLLTSISLYMDGKTYSAVAEGGEGCVQVDLLTDTRCEGSFEGVLVEILEENETKVITNGRFKVKTR